MEKEKIVAVLVEEKSAIDMTPIYYFEAIDTIKKGEILRFDKAGTFVTSNRTIKLTSKQTDELSAFNKKLSNPTTKN